MSDFCVPYTFQKGDRVQVLRDYNGAGDGLKAGAIRIFDSFYWISGHLFALVGDFDRITKTLPVDPHYLALAPPLDAHKASLIPFWATMKYPEHWGKCAARWRGWTPKVGDEVEIRRPCRGTSLSSAFFPKGTRGTITSIPHECLVIAVPGMEDEACIYAWDVDPVLAEDVEEERVLAKLRAKKIAALPFYLEAPADNRGQVHHFVNSESIIEKAHKVASTNCQVSKKVSSSRWESHWKLRGIFEFEGKPLAILGGIFGPEYRVVCGWYLLRADDPLAAKVVPTRGLCPESGYHSLRAKYRGVDYIIVGPEHEIIFERVKGSYRAVLERLENLRSQKKSIKTDD